MAEGREWAQGFYHVRLGERIRCLDYLRFVLITVLFGYLINGVPPVSSWYHCRGHLIAGTAGRIREALCPIKIFRSGTMDGLACSLYTDV